MRRFKNVLKISVVLCLITASISDLFAGESHLISEPESGKIIYVSKSGSNKNDGSKANPLKNIDKAIDISQPGDQIYIAEGTYMGTFDCGYLQSANRITSYNVCYTKLLR